MQHAERLTKALLFEGDVLYPYRASSLKNRHRFPFGTLYPKAFCDGAKESDANSVQTECLVLGERAVVYVSVRYLQLVEGADDTGETVERRADLEDLGVALLVDSARVLEFVSDSARTPEGSHERAREAVRATLTVSATKLTRELYRLTIHVKNDAEVDESIDRASAQLRALVSVHTLLHCKEGRFLSLLEPPEGSSSHAKDCRNQGTWPVLVGPEGHDQTMLSSPFILYDRPAIAKESAGDLFDATEIDEILTLRILTLTADERAEVLAGKGRARELLERTEALDEEARLALHGTFRPREQTRFRRGDHVVLRPGPRGDVLDLALAGEAATVTSVEEDFEGKLHYAVTVDSDPGKDLGELGQPGHRFFFSESELERIAVKPPRILVAGIGNVFLGDDGFGVAVAQKLIERRLPEGVVVMDAGIRGIDLTYALMEGYDAAILVDAASRTGSPGTLYALEPELKPEDTGGDETLLDAHGMDPVRVLRFLRASGAELGQLRVVGCEPESFGTEEDPQLGLSATVRASVEPAVTLVLGLIADITDQRRAAAFASKETLPRA